MVILVLFDFRDVLLDSNALCEVTRLIDVETSCAGYIVAKKLERNDCKRCSEELVDLGYIDHEVCCIFDRVVAERRKSHEVSTAGSCLNEVGKRLLVKVALCENTDNKSAFLDKADRTVL